MGGCRNGEGFVEGRGAEVGGKDGLGNMLGFGRDYLTTAW